MEVGTARSAGLAGFALAIIERLQAVPTALPELILRLGVSLVFFRSFLVKIESWDTTIPLFENEYGVPLLPPAMAAVMAAALELLGPIMLVLGLGTRLAAAAMLAMTAVIQIFVYPSSYPDHLLWAGPLLYLLLRGPGAWSVDAGIRAAFEKRR